MNYPIALSPPASKASALVAPRVAYLASYPPRQCGIATFTQDLLLAVEAETRQPALVAAMNDRSSGYAYNKRVALQLDRNDPNSYAQAARAISQLPVDVINVQHEYGLFGGEWGENLIRFYDRARQPIVTTLHSVIPNPSPRLRHVTRMLAERSAKVVVLAEAATTILNHDYGISTNKVNMIAHGIPTVKTPDASHIGAKAKLGYASRTVLSTFGLISPNKGIEFALQALPNVVSNHPDVLYLVIGQTHPGVRAHEGEAYRSRLQGIVSDLNLGSNVAFVDEYLTLPQLMEYLLATDLYLVPYLNPDQIVSGTLAYAMGSGRAVISTPFIHAREALANRNGVLVPFRDSPAMTYAINDLLDHPTAKHEIELRAYARSRSWTWPVVAARYRHVYEEVTQHAVRTESALPVLAV